MDLIQAAAELQPFQAGGLTARIAQVEYGLKNMDAGRVRARMAQLGVRGSTLDAALELKRAAGQVNVLVHALGILLALPDLLEPGETVQYVSLGAGNTGRPFDLETDRRVAEFKFIACRGGAEAIRQNSLFKDLYLLEAATTTKRKQMFVVDDVHALRFLRSGRALTSVMSRNRKLWADFSERFGSRFATVGDYYETYGATVELIDLAHPFPDRFHPLPVVPDDDESEI